MICLLLTIQYLYKTPVIRTTSVDLFLPAAMRKLPDRMHYNQQKELSYRKQIARQLHTQYVEGTHRLKYYTVTLKSRLRVTQFTGNGTIGQIIHDLLLVELFDVDYYRDLQVWVRGHSRSL